MRVDDGAELLGGLQLGNEIRRHDRRHGEDHVIIADRHLIVAEVEGHHLVVRETKRAQPMPEYDLRLVLAEKAQRRLDENLPKPIAGDERSAGFSPRGQCFADNGAGEDCACLLGLGVERRATFAATPGENAKRPDAKTAWRNLWIAGDWTKTGLPATIEGAIRSGNRAADLVARS